MSLSVPNYLRVVNLQDPSIRYEWDDWKTIPEAEEPDDGLVDRLNRLSQRAVLAFMCGTAEWIYYRLEKLCDDSAPWDYLECAWAMIVDIRYCAYGNGTWWQLYVSDQWVGPVKGPIKDALEVLETAFQQLALEGAGPEYSAGRIAALAAYVMPDPSPYKNWCESVLSRFESLYPRNSEDELGDVVPREAVDPQTEFHFEQTELLINRFLSSLDYRNSKFLSAPEGMLKGDVDGSFKGTPYVFDLELDRQLRESKK